MSKFSFRKLVGLASGPGEARYPTLEEFDRSSRRRFLGQLATVVAGAGGLAMLAGCGERRVGNGADLHPMMGEPALPDAGVDPQPDGWPLSGGAAAPDAAADPDAWPMAGEAPSPDAAIDKTDGFPLSGGKAGPDARIEEPSPGFAPSMDARIDQGECPTP